MSSEFVPADIDLGNGHRLELNPAVFRRLLHSPEVVRELLAHAHGIKRAADELAHHVGRRDRPDPEYGVSLQNDANTTRARAQVYPVNFQAVLDDSMNSTLAKAMLAAEPDHDAIHDDLGDADRVLPASDIHGIGEGE